MPINVVAPPIDAEYAIESNKGTAKFLLLIFAWLEKIAMTDNAIGSIIIVDAVLLTHILIKAVVNMKPAIILLGLVPDKRNKFKAIRL